MLTARKLLDLPRDIHTASSLLTLTTRLLVANPFLLALSPAVLLAALLASIPFLTLVFRLLLVGNTIGLGAKSTWEVEAWAHWAMAGTIAVWLWSWGVAQGLLRVTCAGVVGAWYFAEYVASCIVLGVALTSKLVLCYHHRRPRRRTRFMQR